MPLKKTDQVKIVLRYVETFNNEELKWLRGFIDEKLGAGDAVNPAGNYPVELPEYAVVNYGVNAKLEKRGPWIYIVKGGKDKCKINKHGQVFRPRGKKVVDIIY